MRSMNKWWYMNIDMWNGTKLERSSECNRTTIRDDVVREQVSEREPAQNGRGGEEHERMMMMMMAKTNTQQIILNGIHCLECRCSHVYFHIHARWMFCFSFAFCFVLFRFFFFYGIEFLFSIFSATTTASDSRYIRSALLNFFSYLSTYQVYFFVYQKSLQNEANVFILFRMHTTTHIPSHVRILEQSMESKKFKDGTSCSMHSTFNPNQSNQYSHECLNIRK